MNQLYTTPQASELTGVNVKTLRTWLVRYPEVFRLDVHLIIDENGRKLWTEEGIERIRQHQAGESFSESPEDSEPDAGEYYDQLIEPLLEIAAEQLAHKFLKKLPQRVLLRVRQIVTNPTEEDKEALAQARANTLQSGFLLNEATTNQE